jgi:tRNA(Ile)-lysidine synthase
VSAAEVRRRVDEQIRAHRLIEPGGDVTCLVSGGADSTCLWHVLRALGFRAQALHVAHGLRGADSDADAAFCADALGAEIVAAPGAGLSEAALRELRYRIASDRLRATGHTASDQVETILYRLVSSGSLTGIPVRREDGVVRPLLGVWREETEAYCVEEQLAYRVDASNADTKRGLIRDEILPLLRQLHPAAERSILAAAQERRTLPAPLERAFAELVASREGSKRLDLGGGRLAVREYDRVWVESAPRRLVGRVTWGDWQLEARRPGLHVRGWRAGDRLATPGGKKVQDLFVDAKIPRSERESWPLVVRGDDVVAVPGVAVARGFEDAVVARRESDDQSE